MMKDINILFGNIDLLIKMNKKGFTLIEVLLAIFIFAIVISLIFTAYTGAIRTMNETDAQADISRMASIALERMTEDLESIFVSSWVKPDGIADATAVSGRFLGENDEINGQDADRIRFLSKARIVFDEQLPGAGVAEISYYVKQDEEQEDLILYRRETSVLEASPEEGTGGLEVCRGLRSIEITYLDREGETLEEWDSISSEANKRLPRAVTIILAFWDHSGGEEEAVYSFKTGVALPLLRGQLEQTP